MRGPFGAKDSSSVSSGDRTAARPAMENAEVAERFPRGQQCGHVFMKILAPETEKPRVGIRFFLELDRFLVQCCSPGQIRRWF